MITLCLLLFVANYIKRHLHPERKIKLKRVEMFCEASHLPAE
jgi:hypothetical protein